MANLYEVASALTSEPLLNRFVAASIIAASDIQLESAGTTNHANRLIWANNVMGSDGENYTRTSAKKIIRISLGTNSTFNSIGSNVTDSDIQFITNSLLGNAAQLAIVS